ncbi:Polyketide cyclase / dehydrase and lipid transport [Rubrobacter radiotolerans]|uniref:Polyketide cyclase / dehydrase and lipid transport n=1 Tax=Rubrobacter radiotolerans TaxID=42256 RepID=A0A023X5M9_RUBRA|nr:SRPBCC family protein [Rubrobacter radiotolerans]AHY47374.1 Polyketide cyclase / dehydrase and lipid transport [Rubrobacter radiotolerans]MDX5894778.1 SRPBCC family protein [Rubrobacter radiotolerans]SMC06749.1 Polyketide cyclase / dehydrase and lipid transport [Rubrobacter radiotolerans DSM 5868]
MPQRIESSIEINAPVDKVYEYWETLENLPNFMSNVEEVRVTGERDGAPVTHWSVKGPFGKSVQFDARTTRNDRNEAIAWNSIDGEIETSGQVLFKEVTPNRTRLEVQMNYWDVPGGKVGEAASRITSGPKAIVEQDLRNFRDIMEGRASVEEVQQRPSGAKIHTGGVIAFLTSGVGLATIGGGLLLWLLLRGRSGRSSKTFTSSRRGGVRFTIEI